MQDSARLSARGMCVRDLMTRDVFTMGQNDDLSGADQVMRLGRFRHVVVVDEDGQLAGIVSQRDLFHSGLLHALGYDVGTTKRRLARLRMKEVMTSDVTTAAPDQPLSAAATLMLERKIGCLPVVESGKLVGMLTESDFVRLSTPPVEEAPDW